MPIGGKWWHIRGESKGGRAGRRSVRRGGEEVPEEEEEEEGQGVACGGRAARSTGARGPWAGGEAVASGKRRAA